MACREKADRAALDLDRRIEQQCLRSATIACAKESLNKSTWDRREASLVGWRRREQRQYQKILTVRVVAADDQNRPQMALGDLFSGSLNTMNCDVKQCASGILETLPTMMKVIRGHILQQQPGGLSLPQFRALSFMDQVKNPSLSTVAEHLGLSLAATSRLVNGLVEDSLVKRWPVSTNRRQMALALTKRGKATLEKSRTTVINRLEETLAPIPASDLEIFLRGLEMVRRVFDSNRAPETKVGGARPS